MKFTLKVAKKGTPDNEAWSEDYDIPEVTTEGEARSYGERIVQQFNATLRPHESGRRFVSVQITSEHSDAPFRHDWRKTNMVTVMPKHGMSYDTYRCAACGVTGKRYGLSENVRRDNKFRAKRYEGCDRHLITEHPEA